MSTQNSQPTHKLPTTPTVMANNQSLITTVVLAALVGKLITVEDPDTGKVYRDLEITVAESDTFYENKDGFAVDVSGLDEPGLKYDQRHTLRLIAKTRTGQYIGVRRTCLAPAGCKVDWSDVACVYAGISYETPEEI